MKKVFAAGGRAVLVDVPEPVLRPGEVLVAPAFSAISAGTETSVIRMSADPVQLDAIMLERLNVARKHTGFDPIESEDARMLDFAQQLGVGSRDTAKVDWIAVGPP